MFPNSIPGSAATLPTTTTPTATRRLMTDVMLTTKGIRTIHTTTILIGGHPAISTYPMMQRGRGWETWMIIAIWKKGRGTGTRGGPGVGWIWGLFLVGSWIKINPLGWRGVLVD